MRFLVLGGTRFLGHAVVAHAIANGHEVVCAARGESGAVPDGARLVPLDRDGDNAFEPFAHTDFDAAIDVAQRPSHVRKAVDGLAGRVGHWSFVSSCSVYADNERVGQLAAVAPLLPATDEDSADGENYGPAKVTCEQLFDSAAFICRAGLIVGPGDPSGRFAYWVRWLRIGGQVIAPGAPAEAVQFVDVRDLAAWLVLAAEQKLAGVFDGISAPMRRGDFISEGATALGSTVDPIWVDQQFLLEHEVRPWMGPRSIPLWLPLPEYAGFMTRDVSPALAAGLTPRPAGQTFADTAHWVAGDPSAPVTGLTEAEHAAVIRAWLDRA